MRKFIQASYRASPECARPSEAAGVFPAMGRERAAFKASPASYLGRRAGRKGSDVALRRVDDPIDQVASASSAAAFSASSA